MEKDMEQTVKALLTLVDVLSSIIATCTDEEARKQLDAVCSVILEKVYGAEL